MAQVAGPTAALAGVPAGLQGQGVWAGRRQLFIRFAAEAETATMYTSAALGQELGRLATRSVYHSLSIAGRDPLANAEFLCAVFDKTPPPLPVMLDSDGQRPEAIGELKKHLTLVQVTVEGNSPESVVERGLRTLRTAAEAGVQHGLVIMFTEQTSDAHLLRIVEQAHAASDRTSIVVHPPVAAPLDRDRRWITLMERAAVVHADVRFALRLPSPTGMR